jgi:ribosomal protein S18 acetylase RimI-like enzyme
MEVKIRKLLPGDVAPFMELLDLFRDVLETDEVTKAPPEHLQCLLARPDFIVFVARSANRVVGGATAYVLTPYHSEKPLIYLYDLAVSAACQGQGIGTKLLAQLTQYCRSLGAEELFVQADEEDVQALAFYRATGGAASPVTHFTYLLTD